MWKNRSGYYFLCLTAHFFDKEFNYYSLVVSFRRFHSRHLSDNIETFIKSEITKLNIQHKIRSITTDSGSDMKRAGGLITTRLSCINHDLNLILKNGFRLWSKPNQVETDDDVEDVDEDIGDVASEGDNDDDDDDEEDGNMKSYEDDVIESDEADSEDETGDQDQPN